MQDTATQAPQTETMTTDDVRNVVIIGSGPAGLTAAIYAARANMCPVLFEGLMPGGQLTITTDVENFPGFADPIAGPDLMDAMRTQATNVGTEIFQDEVTRVDLSHRPFTLETNTGKTRANQNVDHRDGSQGEVSGPAGPSWRCITRACRPARRATDFSSGARMSWSWGGEIRRWKRRCIWHDCASR